MGGGAVLRSRVGYVPDPQAGGESQGQDGGKNASRPARAEAPLTMLAFRNTVDPFVGRLTAFRIFAGTLKAGTHLVTARPTHGELVQHLYRIDGNHHAEIGEAVAGEIVGIMKLKDVHVGDTLCAQDAMLRLAFIGEPRRVISYALRSTVSTRRKWAW